MFPENVLAQMRTIRARSDYFLDQGRKLTPAGSSISVGGAHIEYLAKGDALATFLRGIGTGNTPDVSRESARLTAREWVRKWNASREYQVHYSETFADATIDDAWRSIRSLMP
jgi:hypothetical protein